MPADFFSQPILNSPYEYPGRHWELDESGQPTTEIEESRRQAEFITPIPKPKKRGSSKQKELGFTDEDDVSTKEQQYAHTQLINELRRAVDDWRTIPNPGNWRVTPETARLLQHWRSYPFQGLRPFFCQVEAVETAIWLTEVAPTLGKQGQRFLQHLEAANQEANPELKRFALKLATGAGKTTVMAMLIAWQTSPDKCHVNWAILDSGWEGEFCRVVESHPRVLRYVKNHNLGLDVPYRLGSEVRKYRPDFIVDIDDGQTVDGEPDPLHLIIEIKGYRGEDAKVKKETMDVYWVPGVNNAGRYGRWAFAEFCDVYEMEEDFEEKIETEFGKLVTEVVAGNVEPATA